MDNIQQNHKDHLILPKATLVRYRDNTTKKVSFLNLENLTDAFDDLSQWRSIDISQKFPDAFHTKNNFYNPEYDDKVKKYETKFGKIHAAAKNAIEKGEQSLRISQNELHKDIIDFVTIEFYRTVLNNDSLLMEYMNLMQERNDKEEDKLMRQGRLTHEKVEYFNTFRQKTKSIEEFRYYAQNILGTENDVIKQSLEPFTPVVFFIPYGSDYTFLLAADHFLPNSSIAHFILSPDIAISLVRLSENELLNYNKQATSDEVLLYKAEMARVQAMNALCLESVVSLEPEFRDVVGEKKMLESLKLRIRKIASSIKVDSCEVHIDKDFIIERDYTYELVVIIYVMCSIGRSIDNSKLISVYMFESNFRSLPKEERAEVNRYFKKYKMKLIVEN